MPRLARLLRWAAIVLTVAVIGLAGNVAPAAATPPSPAGPLFVAGGTFVQHRTTVIDPVTGQPVVTELSGFEYETAGFTAGSLNPARPDCKKNLPNAPAGEQLTCIGGPRGPRPPPPLPPGTPPGSPQPPPPGGEYCQTIRGVYRIYIPFGPDLLRWRLSFRRCWNGTNVFGQSSTEQVEVLNGSMRVSGTKRKTINPTTPWPVVQMAYDDYVFQYCPFNQCIVTFRPSIGYFFAADGSYIDTSLI